MRAGDAVRELEARLREREAELERLHESLETFTYAVAHDLRAPLRTVQGFVDALLEDHAPSLDARGRFYLQRILASAQLMDRLIQNVQDHSRMQRMDIKPRIVDLDEVVDEALRPLTETVASSSAQVTVRKPLGAVLGHRAMLVKASHHLLDNALKFVTADARPQVEVFAERRDGLLCLCVADNGIGIERDYFERIFGVFERLHGVESYPGTGIGLALVRVAAERLGGRVELESGEGGSRFWLCLPAAP